jgi:hypothetical protein
MTEGLLRPKSLMLGSRAITLSLGILFWMSLIIPGFEDDGLFKNIW